MEDSEENIHVDIGAERVNNYGSNLSHIAPNQTFVILTSQLSSFGEFFNKNREWMNQKHQ